MNTDHIVGELWGDTPPATAKNALQVHVSAIRRLAPGIIETTPSGYRLSADVDTDIFGFEAHARVAFQASEQPDWAAIADACAAAVGLWRGQPFESIPESQDATPVRIRLTEQYLETLERGAEARLSLGREEEVVAELEQLVATYPLRERLWEYLMVGRYRLGRQAEALGAFREVSAILGEELGIEPGRRLRTLEEQILMQLPEVRTRGAATPHNLAVIKTSFIGREDTVTRVVDLATDANGHRLISLVGGPGVGKTRLATEVAWRLLPGFPGGVFMVSLAGASNAAEVAAEIASTVGSSEETDDLEMIARSCAKRPILLVLDNCEHVVAPVNVFCAAATGADGPLRIVTTTRRKIGLSGEHIESVEPLPIPHANETDPQVVLTNPSAKLLIDRVGLYTQDFQPTDPRLSAIVAIVNGTDGVPLALEMAARWIPTVGIQEFNELRDLIEDDSLDGAIELSVRLMPSSDRDFFYAASVFAGKATLETIATVCDPDEALIDAAGSVTRLVESSLMVNELGPSGRMTYSMLRPIREFALERLRDAGKAEEVIIKMVERYRSVAPTFHTETTDAIDSAMPDLRQSLRWLIDNGRIGDAEVLAGALTPYWVARYLTWEADRWFTEILDTPDFQPSLDTIWMSGWVAFNGNAYDAALELYEALKDRASQDGDPLYEGRALYGKARIDLPVDRSAGIETLTHALALFRATESTPDIGECLMALGFGYVWMGQSEQARPFLEEAYSVGESLNDFRLMAQCRRFQTLGAYFDDDEKTAMHHSAESREFAARAADTRVLGGARIQSALVEARWGDMSVAAGYVADALRLLPEAAEVDTALVFVGAIPVLVGSDKTELAAEAFGHIDAIASARNWQPIHTVNPSVAHFRSMLGTIEPPANHLLTTRASVQSALDRITAS